MHQLQPSQSLTQSQGKKTNFESLLLDFDSTVPQPGNNSTPTTQNSNSSVNWNSSKIAISQSLSSGSSSLSFGDFEGYANNFSAFPTFSNLQTQMQFYQAPVNQQHGYYLPQPNRSSYPPPYPVSSSSNTNSPMVNHPSSQQVKAN